MGKKTETKLLDVEKLVFSKTNPRTLLVKFNSADPEFIDLCCSVEQHGILQSILVRPSGSKFEVIDGERRIRAAKKNGIKKVNAEIRELTDTEVIELQLIGFEHRKGIHPLAEATAMQQLIDTGQYSIQKVADRLGKKASYVYQRIQLLKLNDDIKQIFAEGKIELGHAILIAKHQSADQQKIIKHLEGSNFRETAELLRMWISGTLMLNLNKAPFKIGDDLLFQEAGSCTKCQKRTGSTPDLFPEVSGDNICTDPACYKKKVDLHIELAQHLAEEKGEPLVKINTMNWGHGKKDILERLDYEDYDPKKHKKEKAERAIIVKGDGKGKIIQIVKKQEKTPEPEQTEKHEPTPKEIADQENENIKAQREAKLREKLGTEILAHADFKKQILPAVARQMLMLSQGGDIPDYFFFSDDAVYDFEKMSDETIIECFNGGAVADASQDDSNYPISFLVECCGYLGIDYKEIKKKVEEELPFVTVTQVKERIKAEKEQEQVQEHE